MISILPPNEDAEVDGIAIFEDENKDFIVASMYRSLDSNH